MNNLTATPTSRPLKYATPLQVQRKANKRAATHTPPSPSPVHGPTTPQQPTAASPLQAPVQASPLAPPAAPARQPPVWTQRVPSEQATSTMPMPYDFQFGQMLPSTPYGANPPSANFVHALPMFMEPNTMGPIFTTPNRMLEYYAFADASGRTKIAMFAPANCMQSLYQELGCTMPQYRHPGNSCPDTQG